MLTHVCSQPARIMEKYTLAKQGDRISMKKSSFKEVNNWQFVAPLGGAKYTGYPQWMEELGLDTICADPFYLQNAWWKMHKHGTVMAIYQL